ncbi:aldo/keto reductase [Cryobacterium sp. 10I1]|uniref:aldo/keto reductase n=2 Tax=Bacteria TaxID=2 RepID=UPI002B231FBE|nr:MULTISPECIES: aldo/keto reductase [unclassified Cryobacterium]MEB0200347.1 aldo/keto reductase [Cryobacterium sp. 5I3]MEB0306336.1 aldo/keto reductase [Cryobacterium sp. 10I1]
MIQSGIQDSERALHPASAHVAAHPLQGPPPISVSIPVQPDGRLPLVGARRTIADTDLSVHPVALGSSVFGWTADGETSHRILDRHRALGGNFLDTADSYTSGRSEVIIGSWLRSRKARDSTVIATKIGKNRDNPGLSSRSIIGAVQASLDRLGTDYIDLLHFHFDDPTVPLEESLGAVDVLMRSGQVRYLAASNFSGERLMEARILAANGLPRFVALQTEYSLLQRRGFESSLSLVTRAQGLAVLPYFSLAHGFLAGRYRSKADLHSTTRDARAAKHLSRPGLRVLSVVDRIAADHDTGAASIALAWLLAQAGVTAPVAGASQPDQVDSLIAAAGIRLTRSDMVDLERVTGLAAGR